MFAVGLKVKQSEGLRVKGSAQLDLVQLYYWIETIKMNKIRLPIKHNKRRGDNKREYNKMLRHYWLAELKKR